VGGTKDTAKIESIAKGDPIITTKTNGRARYEFIANSAAVPSPQAPAETLGYTRFWKLANPIVPKPFR
jgi:hypothetical protein